jgi:hypothetical protein
MSLLDVIVVLAAQLPDPGNPFFATLGAGCGGFAGGVVGYLRRHPEERVRRLMTDGSLIGFGTGFVCWLVALAIDRL